MLEITTGRCINSWEEKTEEKGIGLRELNIMYQLVKKNLTGQCDWTDK